MDSSLAGYEGTDWASLSVAAALKILGPDWVTIEDAIDILDSRGPPLTGDGVGCHTRMAHCTR